MGLTRKLSPSFLIGVLGGYETFNYTSQVFNGRMKGDGWTAGSYLGWKLSPGIRFDAAIAYSGIGYDGVAGTASGNFRGNRWLFSSGLTGNYKTFGVDIEPSVKVYALREHEQAYTDSLGILQADRVFSTGRASAGAKLAYPWVYNDAVTFAPYLGLYADYYFTRDNAEAIAYPGGASLASFPLLEGGSARAIGGLTAKLSNGAAITMGGELGGIGSVVQIWTWRVRGSVPF